MGGLSFMSLIVELYNYQAVGTSIHTEEDSRRGVLCFFMATLRNLSNEAFIIRSNIAKSA
jgi:hypothetical protein